MKTKNDFISGFDSYNLCLTGEIGRTLATPCGGLNEHIPVIILNDQGGSVLDTSEDVTACLRAQDHGHPPVICQLAAFMGGQGAKARSIAYCDDGTTPTLKSVLSGGNTVPDVVYCFEPGIAKREGCESRFVQGMCGTLRADMGDNQTAVCYPINLMVATRGGRDDLRTCFGIGEPDDPQFTLSAAHEHGVCYAVDSHPMDSRFGLNGDITGTVTTKLAKGSADGPLVMIKHE